MTKQEEIREGIAREVTGLGRNPNKWSYEFADKLLAYLDKNDIVIKVERELPVEEDNMGNMSKAEAIDFFTFVINDLGIILSLEFTPTAPSIYLGEKILFCECDLHGYKWQVKEKILHEIAHHLEVGKRRHGTNFYKVFAELVSKYLAGYVAVEPLIEEDVKDDQEKTAQGDK